MAGLRTEMAILTDKETAHDRALRLMLGTAAQENMMKTTPDVGFNFAPGIAVLAMSILAVVIGFTLGAKVVPFGGVSIAACLLCAIQMKMRRSVAPGYASFFIAVPAIAAAVLLSA